MKVTIETTNDGLGILFIRFLGARFSNRHRILDRARGIALALYPTSLGFAFRVGRGRGTRTTGVFGNVFSRDIALTLARGCSVIMFSRVVSTVGTRVLARSRIIRFVAGTPSDVRVVVANRGPSRGVVSLYSCMARFGGVGRPCSQNVANEVNIRFWFWIYMSDLVCGGRGALRHDTCGVMSSAAQFVNNCFFTLFCKRYKVWQVGGLRGATIA